MNKRLGLVLLLISQLELGAYVTFFRHYGGSSDDRALDVQVLADGGYVLAGETGSYGAGELDLWILRVDSLGNVIWSNATGGGYNDGARSIALCSDGGFVLAGRTSSLGNGLDDVYVVKFSASGQVLWEKTYGGSDYDEARSIMALPDGGFIVAGRTKSFGSGNYDVYLLRLDENGDTLWTKTFGGSNNDEGYCVTLTSDGCFAVTGRTASVGPTGSNILLLKVTSSGNGEWMKAYGGINWDEGYSLTQTDDGGFLVVGKTLSEETGSFDIYMVRTDADGDTLWTRTLGGPNDEEAWHIEKTDDGGFMMTGGGVSPDDDWQVFLYKLDSAGNPLWMREYGGPLVDIGYSVRIAADGGFVMAGKSARNGAGDDVCLIKTDPEGMVGVEEGLLPSNLSERRLLAYPNPFVGTCLLNRKGPLFFVYDERGRLVLKTFGPEIGEGLQPGVYFVRTSGCIPLMLIKLR